MKSVEIAGRRISEDDPTFIIAEIGQGHDGSLGLAHSYIDSAADAGVDAVKFQTHIAGDESSIDDVFRVKFSRQDSSRFEYWKRMEFTESQWEGLYEHTKDRGIVFLSSAFSARALQMLIDFGMPAIKVASGEVLHQSFMDAVKSAGLPVLLSSGMSSWSEIDQSIELLNMAGIRMVLMQCTSQYPTTLDCVGLNVVSEMKARYGVLIGLSDHSGTLFPGLTAISRSFNTLEVHIAYSKDMFGPDTSSSITLDELAFLVRYRDAVYEMDKKPVDKNKMATELNEVRQMFTRSIALKKDLKKGTILVEEDLIEKKPGSGISPVKSNEVVGRRLRRDVDSNRLLTWDDLDD